MPEGALDLLSLVPEFRESVTTDEMLSILERIGMRESILERMMERITWNLGQRTRGQIETGLVMFSRERGLLGQTGPVEELIGEIQTKEKEDGDERNLIWDRRWTGGIRTLIIK